MRNIDGKQVSEYSALCKMRITVVCFNHAPRNVQCSAFDIMNMLRQINIRTATEPDILQEHILEEDKAMCIVRELNLL